MNFGNCYCNDPILPHKPLDFAAPDLFSTYGYVQLIDIPTRVTNSTISLIDTIHVSSEDLVLEYGTLPQIADHEGIVLCLDVDRSKRVNCSRTLFDYCNADVEGLEKYIKEFDFQTSVFNLPFDQQAEKFIKVLEKAFNQFIPKKTIFIKDNSPPWCNKYTRLLIRKKNRNYKFFKKTSNQLSNATKNNNSDFELITRLSLRKSKAHNNFKQASRESSKANLRVKNNFFNSVNQTMLNPEISAKKKFSILKKLLNSLHKWIIEHSHFTFLKKFLVLVLKVITTLWKVQVLSNCMLNKDMDIYR